MHHQFITKKHTYVAVAFFISIVILSGLGVHITHASTIDGTIVSGGSAGYAWSDKAGWVNFGVSNGNIHITDSGITGYAWNANYGWINMSPTNGGVIISSAGTLSGSAWGSGLGWINFSGASINSSGKFTGTATGTNVGTLTFDCDNCNVTTDYRPFDFRTTPSPTPTPSGGGGGGGGFFIPPTPSTGTSSPDVTVPQNSNDTSSDTGTSSPDNKITTPQSPNNTPSNTGTASPLSAPTGSNTSTDAGSGIVEPTDGTPAQLFDIRLILDRPAISRIIDLVARVTFTSFGRIPTPVEMTFSVIDAGGKEIWKSVDTTTVQTEAVFVKRFLNINELAPGAYTLRLHTQYNKNVEDIFEAKFTVTSPEAPSYWILWLIGGLVLILIIIFLILWKRRKKEEDTENRYKRYDSNQ